MDHLVPQNPDYKRHAKKAITDWLRGTLRVRNISALQKRYNRISKSTFYRLLDECRAETGIKEPLVIDGVVESSELVEAVNPPKGEEISVTLPPVVAPVVLARMSGFNAVELIGQCVKDAHAVKQFCLNQDGKIRNAKLFLQASAHARSSAETLSRIAERINDAQKIEQMLNTMIEEVRRESPEVADRILARLAVLLDAWGM